MKTKSIFLILLFPLIISLGACSNTSNLDSYNGKNFDISLAQDNSLTLKSIKQGSNFTLEINGEGKGKDYSVDSLPEWSPLNDVVSEININEGITHIGSYYFNEIDVEEVLLPVTVTSLGEKSFHQNTKLFSYSDTLVSTENEIYYYRETNPNADGNYFYIEDGEIMIWEKSENQKLSILFIGNSYTYYGGKQSLTAPGVPMYFKDIATNLGYDFEVDWVVKGSHKLALFANVQDEMGKIVDDKLQTKTYTHVILQEHSTTPVKDYQLFATAVKSLKTKIDKYQDNCKTVLYQTWGSEGRLSGTGCKDIVELEMKLREAYTNVGNKWGCDVHYVGKAFTTVYQQHPEINLYNKDKVHQSDYGAYLSALVHVKGVFNADLSKVDNYSGLSSKDCKTLINVAINN